MPPTMEWTLSLLEIWSGNGGSLMGPLPALRDHLTTGYNQYGVNSLHKVKNSQYKYLSMRWPLIIPILMKLILTLYYAKLTIYYVSHVMSKEWPLYCRINKYLFLMIILINPWELFKIYQWRQKNQAVILLRGENYFDLITVIKISGCIAPSAKLAWMDCSKEGEKCSLILNAMTEHSQISRMNAEIHKNSFIA